MTRARRAEARERHPLDRILLYTVSAGAFLIPLVISTSGFETYRTPKLLLLRFEAIVALAAFAIGWIWNWDAIRDWRPPRFDAIVACAAIAWTVVTSLLSPYPSISFASLITVVVGLVVYFAAMRIAPRVSTSWLYVLFVPVVVNAAVLLLQLNDYWVVASLDDVNKMLPIDRQRVAEAALLGNRDDIGTAILIPALLAWALVMQRGVRRRWIHAIAALVLTGAVIVTRTFTTFGALLAGLVMLLAMKSWKRAVPAIAAVVLLAGAFAYFDAPMRNRIEHAMENFRGGEVNEASSGRLVSFRAAWHMFKDHPLTGVGPGRFGGEFFRYGLIPGQPGPSVGFGEAHNDHLQTLAETGVAGYAIFLAAVAVLALNARGARPDERAAFARDASLPVATAFFVSALAQFPLQLAAPIVVYATTAGLLRGWAVNE